jgi:ubiquinone/menaquinone biosynthesis C-methylase UbiE
MDRNPQAKQMADESMVRNLAAQAEAIWPQEQLFVRRYFGSAAGGPTTILDVGCGTGEITSRLAAMFPRATAIGVDIIDAHLALARERYAAFGERVRFQHGDAFELPFAAGSFDLVVCRHMLQAVPEPERVLAELVRVGKPGGWLHVIAEDYDMIHAAPTRIDVSPLWHDAPRAFGKATNTDLHIGTSIYHHLSKLPVTDIRIDHVVVDTLRVPRATFAAIFTAWRDGYVEPVAEALGVGDAQLRDYFDATIECILDPAGYVVWMVPVVSARIVDRAPSV